MPAYNNPKKTRQYSNEFKAKAVKLSHLKRASVKAVAESLGIRSFMLSRLRKEYREGKTVSDNRKNWSGSLVQSVKTSGFVSWRRSNALLASS